MKLTTKKIQSLQSRDKRYDAYDGQVTGLHVRVSTTGAKNFYVRARSNGKSRRVKIGNCAFVSSAQARQRAIELIGDMQLGRSETLSFDEARDLFIEGHAKPNTKGWKNTLSLLQKFEFDKPVDKLTRRDLTGVINIIAQRTPVRARRAHAAISKMFNWLVEQGHLHASPVVGMRPPGKEIPRDRVLTDTELRALWLASESYPYQQFLQLLILTSQRRGEVAGMRWSEIDGNDWIIPANRAKNATAHIVPLAPLAQLILKELPRFEGSDLVFTTTGTTPISGFGKWKKRLEAAIGATDWRPHDIRRTVATNMAKMRVPPHVIEAVLNHKSGIVSGVAAVYNQYSYIDEKREALERWADYVNSGI